MNDVVPVTISYDTIATMVFSHFQTDERMHIDTLDRILQANGLHPTGAGRRGRQDWNYKRNLHRKNINTLLRRYHQMSLEVKSTGKRDGVFYHLVPAMKVMVNAPVIASAKFARQVTDKLGEFRRMVEAEFPAPNGASPEVMEEWRDYISRKAELLQQQFELDFRMAAVQSGLGEWLAPRTKRIRRY